MRPAGSGLFWRRQRRPADIPEGTSQAGTLRREARYRRLLGLADVVSAAIAVVVAVRVVGSDGLRPSTIVLLPLAPLLSKAIGLYDRDQHLVNKPTLDEAPTLFGVATLYTLVLSLSDGLFIAGHLGRDQLLGLWIFLVLSMMTCRTVARRIARASSAPERIVVIGDARTAAQIKRKLELTHGVKAKLVGRVPLSDIDTRNGSVPVLGELGTLGLTLVENDVDRAVIAPRGSSSDDYLLDVIRIVKALGVSVSVLPSMFEVVGSAVEFDDVNGMLLLGLRRYGLTSSSRLLKRTMDLAGATVLLVLLTPLLAFIAVAVLVDSRGHVLFRQRRIGRADREFVIFKFRTMVDGAEALKDDLRQLNETEGIFKLSDDPRVTRIGSFLRRSSLDELPQLFNVLRGDMSLVGPRPLVPDEDARVEGIDRRRLTLKPGMTGMWQIFGSSHIPLREMVKIDYLYGVNWSLWLDCKILMRTVPHAFGRRGL